MTASRPLRILLVAATLVALGSAPPTRSQDATPDAGSRTTLYASDADLDASLSAGTPGQVSVVSQSPALGQGDRVIAVVRNGTDRPVSSLTVKVIVRDMSRQIVASGSALVASPVAVPPGGLALVRVPLTGGAAPGMAGEITVDSTPPDPDRMDLAIRYADLSDDVLSGSMTAIDVDAAYDPELLVACVGDDGAVTDYAFAPLQPRRIAPYRTIPFRIAMPDGCDRFLAAATAHR